MRPANAQRGLYVPPQEVPAYIACGWTALDELNCHQVLVIPPDAKAPPKSEARTR
jgi:hypothetical protein